MAAELNFQNIDLKIHNDRDNLFPRETKPTYFHFTEKN